MAVSAEQLRQHLSNIRDISQLAPHVSEGVLNRFAQIGPDGVKKGPGKHSLLGATERVIFPRALPTEVSPSTSSVEAKRRRRQWNLGNQVKR